MHLKYLWMTKIPGASSIDTRVWIKCEKTLKTLKFHEEDDNVDIRCFLILLLFHCYWCFYKFSSESSKVVGRLPWFHLQLRVCVFSFLKSLFCYKFSNNFYEYFFIYSEIFLNVFYCCFCFKIVLLLLFSLLMFCC